MDLPVGQLPETSSNEPNLGTFKILVENRQKLTEAMLALEYRRGQKSVYEALSKVLAFPKHLRKKFENILHDMKSDLVNLEKIVEETQSNEKEALFKAAVQSGKATFPLTEHDNS